MDSKQESENPMPTTQSSANPPGRFIAIEGVDGSGKATQAKLLAEHARSLGYDVLEISFPRYGNDSAYYVEQYLNGKYGTIDEVHPEIGSLPYALDRFATKDEITAHLAKPKSLVISDRYMASNLAHQGAKIADESERHEFYRRTLLTEYGILGIPKPDLNIVLLVPAEISQSNVDKKAARSYTTQKRDIHEADASHLEKAKRNYEEICELYTNEFHSIKCSANTQVMRSVDSIANDIRIIAQLFAAGA